MTTVPEPTLSESTALLSDDDATIAARRSSALELDDGFFEVPVVADLRSTTRRGGGVRFLATKAGVAILALCLAVRVFGNLESAARTATAGGEPDDDYNNYYYYHADGATYLGWEDHQRELQRQRRLPPTGSLLGGSTTTAGGGAASAVAVEREEEETHDPHWYFNTTAAYSMLDPATADFYRYQNGWEAQITQALCAIATSAALLNSLRDEESIDLPVDPVYRPFPWATQSDVLGSSSTDRCVYDALGGGVSNADSVYHMGLGHAMIPRLLNCFLEDGGYAATGYAAADDDDDDSKEASTKEILVESLRDPRSRVLLNYDRFGIGQGTARNAGHWSPIGGYDASTDRFLIMDVAKYKHPMVWVTWSDLWKGANTIDLCGETLSLDRPDIDWSLLRGDRTSPAARDLFGYLEERCVTGHRGFVVVAPETIVVARSAPATNSPRFSFGILD